MNFSDDSQGRVSQPSDRIVLTVYHTMPSANQILAMNQWDRQRERVRTQQSVLCALRASAHAAQMNGTYGTSISSMHLSKLESYLTTRRSGAGSKSRKNSFQQTQSAEPKL